MKDTNLSTGEAQMLVISKTQRSFTLQGIYYLVNDPVKREAIGAKKIMGRWVISRKKFLKYLGY